MAVIRPRNIVLLVLTLLCPVVRAADECQWPFGLPASADSMAMLKKLDLYNLGLLGAKAWDADKPDPDRTVQTGRRRFGSNGSEGPDVGPRRLKIFALFPKGPAVRGGLKLGDIVTGVDNSSFTEGFYEPLARALLAAEAGERKGELVLQVERGGEPLELTVKIPSGGKEALRPTEGKAREEILAAALKFLADRQVGDGGFPETTGGATGAVVQTSVAGLAWIAGGSNLAGGRHKKNLKSAREFVLRGLNASDPFAGLRSSDSNWNQTTWGYAYAAIFLGELHAAKPSGSLKKDLQEIADELCKRQEESGGYGHGPGGVNALGYIELNILGSLVLTGLGLAKKAGCRVDDAAIDRLLAYLEASASQDGGVGYSTERGQAGRGNIGRTAAAWLGAVAYGRRQDAWCKQMEGYVVANLTDVFGGHASLMQHIVLSGLAAAALGPEKAREWWQAREVDLTLARAPDGSIQPRVWRESITMQSNTDVGVGEIWTTASWAAVLGADPARQKGGLKGLCEVEEGK